eukprot:g16383.t1
MHAMRSATRIRALKFRGTSPHSGGSSSRSKAVFLSALATLGGSNASTASALSSTAITMSGARLLATSAASTLAVTLMMPQGVTCSGRRAGDEDNDGDGNGNGNVKALLRIAKGVFLGDDDDADSKSRRAKAGKGGDDAENAKKLVQDLVDAFNGFGKDVTQAVDGAVKRKNTPAGGGGLGEAVRERLNSLVQSGVPSQISFGFGMGFCCGFAAKKTAKAALVGIGLAFGSLQLLSYMGYVELDYSKIEGEVMTSLDLNEDGKVDSDDVKEIWDRTMKVLSYNLPTGSGFAAGALVGARMG